MKCLNGIQINMGPHKIKIKVMDEISNHPHRIGEFNLLQGCIKLKSGLNDTLIKETVMHEMVHAFINYNGLFHHLNQKQQEAVCDNVSHNMLTFIKHNKKFFIDTFLD
jgi:CO dehydrogenase/acetyl-CoA synthase beta subunit